MKIYIHSLLNDHHKNQLSGHLSGDELFFRTPGSTETELKSHFQKANYILGNPPLDWFHHYAPAGLYFLQLDSAGFDQYKNIPHPYKAANMGDWFARPCAETTIAGILALYRGIDKLTTLKTKHNWIGSPLREELKVLFGQKAVILGTGTIGQSVRDILTGFRCRLISFARSSPLAEIHQKDELLEHLEDTDVLINTLPGSAAGFVDKSILYALKRGAVYANIGRGNTTDEAALLQALADGQLSGAALDVTLHEPLPEDHPLWTLPNVVLTQHTGGGQANENNGKVELFLKNMSLIKNNQEPVNLVDLQKGY